VKQAIIVDTDPGQDDAVAILLALASGAQLDLPAITTVAGNVPLAQTTRNALRICDLARRPDVPVYAGAARPIIHELATAEFVCGPDGLAGADLPPAQRSHQEAGAIPFIIGALRAAPERGITLCPLGPLTNIALALRLAPDIAPKIRRIVLMGGALALGNITPAAEFNFWVDPHAAAIVFGAGIPLAMMGLHLTHQAVCDRPRINRLGALGTATGRAIHGMLTRPRPGGLGTSGHPMHDPCVVAYLLWPELFAGRDCFVEIETGDGPLRGRSTIDWNNRLKQAPNALVLDRVEADTMFDRLIDAIATLP
jgi:inosine-uridine nucleoside N-ribohydrolase